jgi:hypothetical protein
MKVSLPSRPQSCKRAKSHHSFCEPMRDFVVRSAVFVVRWSAGSSK